MLSIFRRKQKEDPSSDISILLEVSRELENNILEQLQNPKMCGYPIVSTKYIMKLNMEREAALKSELTTPQILEIILRIRRHHSQLESAKKSM